MNMKTREGQRSTKKNKEVKTKNNKTAKNKRREGERGYKEIDSIVLRNITFRTIALVRGVIVQSSKMIVSTKH